MTPCMGGWCNSRGKCAHYHADATTTPPVERLCGDVEEPEPMRDQERAKLAADPRFAAWVAGSKA